MKQGTFIIEFFQPSEDRTYFSYLVRTTNGQIVKHCLTSKELIDFLDNYELKTFYNGQEQNSKKDN